MTKPSKRRSKPTAPSGTPTDAGIDPATDSLARTIYGEARGETTQGKEAVAAVVMNRVRRAQETGGRYWWGATVEEVCRRPWQFSCWNADDPNRKKLEAVTPANKAFQACLRIAGQAIAGKLKDPTGGATHYHAWTIRPTWAKAKTPSAEIGGHLFYNDVE